MAKFVENASQIRLKVKYTFGRNKFRLKFPCENSYFLVVNKYILSWVNPGIEKKSTTCFLQLSMHLTERELGMHNIARASSCRVIGCRSRIGGRSRSDANII